MKVLAINGSARSDGNTASLIRILLDELNHEGIDTEMIQLSENALVPCKACWSCGGRKNCALQNDAFGMIFEKAVQADGLILGSPVYAANISANMQAFLERASVVTDMNRKAGLFRRKVGAAVTVARRSGALQALDAMNHFFMLQEMFIASAAYWPLAYGRTPGEVLHDDEGLRTMRTLGQNMAWLLKRLH